MEVPVVTILSLLLSILQYVLTDSSLSSEWTMLIPDCDFANRTKGCFRDPPDCKGFLHVTSDPNSIDGDLWDTSCNFVVRWQQTFDQKSMNFEIYASPLQQDSRPEYVAMAFSHDMNMAKSDVYACLEKEETIQIVHYENTVSHVSELKEMFGVNRISGSFINGILNCNFTRVKQNLDAELLSKLRLKHFYDLNKPFHMLASRGRSNGGELSYHTVGRWISTEKYDFSQYTADPEPTTQPLDPDLGYRNTGRSGGLVGGQCPCQNSGKCGDGLTCVCTDDYHGDRCQYKSAGNAVLASQRILSLTLLMTIVLYYILL